MSKNKAYEKSIIREILTSKVRFASILVIILLGVAFYAGIKSSGPDMNKTINKLYNTYNLMDSKIVSSLGLSDKDIDLLKIMITYWIFTQHIVLMQIFRI